MPLREPPTQWEMARLAELYLENQLSKKGAGFVSYPLPTEPQPLRPLLLNRTNQLKHAA